MGKVHGSLARAGKVRNQTPKVAKQVCLPVIESSKHPNRAIIRAGVRSLSVLPTLVRAGEEEAPQGPRLQAHPGEIALLDLKHVAARAYSCTSASHAVLLCVCSTTAASSTSLLASGRRRGRTPTLKCLDCA